MIQQLRPQPPTCCQLPRGFLLIQLQLGALLQRGVALLGQRAARLLRRRLRLLKGGAQQRVGRMLLYATNRQGRWMAQKQGWCKAAMRLQRQPGETGINM
jgi:hypothetical protein